MKPWKATLHHTLELAAIILAAFVISKLFNISSEDMQAIIALVIAAFVKYARVAKNQKRKRTKFNNRNTV